MVVGILLLPVQADARIVQKAFRSAAGYVRACSGSLSMRTPAEPAQKWAYSQNIRMSLRDQDVCRSLNFPGLPVELQEPQTRNF